MATTDFIEIDLDAAQDGVVPTIRDNLHDEDLKRAVELIRRLARPAYEKRRAQLQPATLRPAARAQLPTRRGLLIEGERGIGKTSFLLALSATFNDEKTSRLDLNPTEPRVHALPLIDPSLISGDRTFIATVIANVLSEVERSTNPQPQLCDPRQRSARAELDKALQGLHDGLLAESEETWRSLTSNRQADGQFVDHLLRAARGGLSLADRFEAFTRLAADMLGADMLLQPLDDVDLAGPEAYTTLEAVRRYMTGPSLLPVVAGDLEQFISMIWERRLQDEEQGLRARPEAEMGGAAARRAALRDLAGQAIDKLLPPNHRFPLPSRRAEVLRRGLAVRAPTGPLPVLGWAEGEPAPAKVSCLVGRAEATMAPGPGRLVSGILLPLVPANTRAMFTSLRLLRDSISADPELPPSRQRTAVVEALQRLGHVFAAELSATGLRPAQLRRLAEEGPTDDTTDALRVMWAQPHTEALDHTLPLSRSAPATTLVTLGLAQWLAGHPVRALSLLGLHAPYLTPRVDGRRVPLRPSDVALNAEVSVAAATESVRPVEARPIETDDFHWRQGAGFWLRELGPTASSPLLRHAFSRLKQDRPQREDLHEYTTHLRARAANETNRNPGVLINTGAVSSQWKRPDATLFLLLTRTSIKMARGSSWFVNPRRVLEVAARASEVVARAPTAGPAAHAATITRDLSRTYIQQDTRISGALTRLRGPTVQPMAMLAEALVRWASAPAQAVSLVSLIAAHRRWEQALQTIADDYEGRLATVGGYMQRCVVALFSASIEAELLALGGPGAIRTEGASPGDDASWSGILTDIDDYTVYLQDQGYAPPSTPRSLFGRLHRLIGVLSACRKGESEDQRRRWARENLPLSTLLVTCPLLVPYLSRAWRDYLGEFWSLPQQTPIKPGEPDIHTLLCGVVIAPSTDDGEYPTVKWIEENIGEGILSDTEKELLVELNNKKPTP